MISATSDIGTDATTVGSDNAERSVGCAQAPDEPSAIARHHLDEPRRDDAEQLVPFQVQRARVVRLELEPAALEAHDLAGDPVAVGKDDDVGPALAVHTAVPIG